MSEKITLYEKMPSSKSEDLIALLKSAEGAKIHLDGLRVISIGARSAEILARFVHARTAEGDEVTIDASADLTEDLRLLGMSDHLALEGGTS